MKFLIGALVLCLLLSRPARAQPAQMSCASLSPQAVKIVPPPFNVYMRLVCYTTGTQALEPPAGTEWSTGKVNVALSAMDDRHLSNSGTPVPNAPDWHMTLPSVVSWYVALVPRPISPANDAALRGVLGQSVRPLFLDGASLIELDAITSAGELKQEFLLLPADPVATHGIKILMECHEFCQGDDTPWIFGVIPDADE